MEWNDNKSMLMRRLATATALGASRPFPYSDRQIYVDLGMSHGQIWASVRRLPRNKIYLGGL
jgi:hypothetical protein